VPDGGSLLRFSRHRSGRVLFGCACDFGGLCRPSVVVPVPKGDSLEMAAELVEMGNQNPDSRRMISDDGKFRDTMRLGRKAKAK
jgi:hypothetical protein